MIRFAGRGLLLDIEGTVASIRYVYDVLFPYARRELPQFLAANWNTSEVAAIREMVAADAGDSFFRPVVWRWLSDGPAAAIVGSPGQADGPRRQGHGPQTVSGASMATGLFGR